MQQRILLVIDYQNDFTSKAGALYVPESEGLAPNIDRLIKSGGFDKIIATQDWHPADHSCFNTSSDPLLYQRLWPPHCVKNTWGAQLSLFSIEREADVIWRKGKNRDVDSYSAARDYEGTLTGLLKLVQSEEVWLCGVALDCCVKQTALDCIGYVRDVHIVTDAVAAMSSEGEQAAYKEMLGRGILLTTTDEVCK
jgi:nicotinamidase/pyrazinamidase